MDGPIPIERVAEMLSTNGMNVTVHQLYRARYSGKLICVKFGRRLGVMPREIERYIELCQQLPIRYSELSSDGREAAAGCANARRARAIERRKSLRQMKRSRNC